MKPYTAYKQINLPWLKSIPDHWEIWRNKNIFTELKEEVGDEVDSHRLLSLTLNGIIPRDVNAGGKFPSSFEKYKIVKTGNMAFCLFDIDETPRTVGLSQYDGMLTGAYTIMRVDNINSKYAYYYYLALDNGKKLKPLYKGLRKTIDITTFQSAKLPVPPRNEQDQIVRFLDWKVSAINKLINVRKQRLEIIDELRLSVINKAIKQAMEQENSCQYMRLKTLLITHFSGCWGEDAYEGGNNHLCIRVADFDFDKLLVNPSANTMRHYTNKQFQTHHLLDKDLLLEKSGGGKKTSVGRVVRYRGCDTPSMFANFCECLRPNLKIVDSDYLAFLLKAFYHNRNMGELYTQTTGIQNINLRKYLNILLPVLPLTVQKQIITNIEEHFTINDRLVLVEKQEIDLLRELKNRLISDVVTGQIDVRNIEIPEYEYVDEELESDSDDVDGDFDSEDISEEA